MINCIIAEELILHFALVHLHFVVGMHSRLNASSWKLSLHPLTPPFTSLAPSLTMTQAISLNIDTLWRWTNTRRCGPMVLPMKLDCPGHQKCPRHWHMFFHPQVTRSSSQMPTYGRICCNYQPQKEEKHHVRLTIGSNWINYPGNKSTPTANLTTAKLLIDSTISSPGAKFLGIDLAIFYLNTPMPNLEYMCLHLDIILNKIIIHYNLCNIVTPEGWVYIKIWKEMYGLPQASILANHLLKKCLAIKGYYQCQQTPGLWRQAWQNITFCLVVNDFWHQGHQHARHGPPCQCIKGTLHRCNQHDGFSVLRHSSNLELHARTHWLPYAQVHQQSPHKVPTPQTSLSPTCSPQGGLDTVWHTGSEGGGWHHTISLPKGDQMHPRHHWYPLVLCMSSTSCCTQCHCNIPKQRHKGSGWCMSPTLCLHHYTSQCRHLVQGVHHGTISMHGRFILFWTRW